MNDYSSNDTFSLLLILEIERKKRRAAEYKRRYREKNRDKIRVAHQKYRQDNKDKINVTSQKWRLANREKKAKYDQKRWREEKEEIVKRRKRDNQREIPKVIN